MFAVLWTAPNVILEACTRFVTYTSQTLLLLSFLLSIAHYLGWIHRLIWHLLESELSKLLNGTPVTVGSFKVDLIRGRLWVSNLVLHAPRRHEWKWESPVLARVGNIYVEANLVLCILSDWFLREQLPLDIYSVECSDIQAFVERKQQIFNFYLMDPHIDVPAPVDEEDGSDSTQQQQQQAPIDTTLNPAWDVEHETPEHEKAQRLVGDMVRAIGRAAQRGGSLQDALVENRQTITTKLKALQTTKKSEAMQEGVKIVQHVSKSLVEKTHNVQHIVVPARRQLENEIIVYGRIGRVIVQDARVFTRDHHWENNNNEDKTTSTTATGRTSSSSSWNKPIYIEQMVVRAAELCPPLSAKDDRDFPAIYQPLDRCLEVIWKRVITEMAKSNTGHLFQTAMGEVLEYWMEKDNVVPNSESN